jgi:hypothetical protein
MTIDAAAEREWLAGLPAVLCARFLGDDLEL